MKVFSICNSCGVYYRHLSNHVCGSEPDVDPVSAPAHYNHGKYKPWDVIDDWQLHYYTAAALEYICRAGHKDDEVLDLKKAVAFLQRRIKNLEEEEDQSQ